jgi:hypothetical protein
MASLDRVRKALSNLWMAMTLFQTPPDAAGSRAV